MAFSCRQAIFFIYISPAAAGSYVSCRSGYRMCDTFSQSGVHVPALAMALLLQFHHLAALRRLTLSKFLVSCWFSFLRCFSTMIAFCRSCKQQQRACWVPSSLLYLQLHAGAHNA
jgi:hypothetical protein